MALTGSEKLILIAVLAAAMAFTLYFELRYMRGKKKEVRYAAQRRDEAYNAILTTRSVIGVMARKGADVSGARSLLSSAQRAMDRGELDRCMELCEQAREELIRPGTRSRTLKARAPDEEAEKDSLEKVAESILASDEGGPGADTYAGTKLAMDKDSNYLSAKFEINTARADIRKASEKGLGVAQAQVILAEAESAFAAGNYSKALSLAVRVRKAVSAQALEETIPLGPEPAPPEPEAPEAVEEAPEHSEPSEPLLACKRCGAPLDQGDAFCGICGARVELERVCASCGSKGRPGDAFCRKCGAKLG